MKGRRMLYLAAAASAVAAALVLPGTAGAANNLVCGGTLDTSVALPANMDCSGTGASALEITKSGVTLDLGGHTITGNPSNIVIQIDSGVSNVTIENGTITGGFDQIRTGPLWDDTGHADYLTIQNMTLTDAVRNGIRMINVAGGLVQGNHISGAGFHAIYSQEGAGNAFFSNVISDTGTLYGTSFNMKLDDEQYSYVEGNTSFISGNTYQYNRNFEDYYGDGDLWYGNVAYGGYYGYYMYSDEDGVITVTNNGAAGQTNGGYGFYIEDYFAWSPMGRFTLVNGNTATGGIDGATGFYTSYNVGETFTGNTANRNDGDGIYNDEPWQETITNNVSKFNNGDGFYLSTYGDEGAPISFANNLALYNQQWGFESEYATVGSGNSGLVNGSPSNNGGDCLALTGCA